MGKSAFTGTMHTEQTDFCRMVLDRYPHFQRGVAVLDVGSRDINGNNRVLFSEAKYTGVDVSEGLNVDVVCFAHELYKHFPQGCFDVVISTEMLEHDPNYVRSCTAMLRSVRSGGLLLITCATTGRPEHGTRRTGTVEDNPAVDLIGNDYYRNLTPEDLHEALPPVLFETHGFEINHTTHDLYFWGIKK